MHICPLNESKKKKKINKFLKIHKKRFIVRKFCMCFSFKFLVYFGCLYDIAICIKITKRWKVIVCKWRGRDVIRFRVLVFRRNCTCFRNHIVYNQNGTLHDLHRADTPDRYHLRFPIYLLNWLGCVCISDLYLAVV